MRHTAAPIPRGGRAVPAGVLLVGALFLLLNGKVLLRAQPAAQQVGVNSAELRGVQYLTREVPNWEPENHCYSCHNNGDGARALFAAAGSQMKVPAAAFRPTLDWLARPDAWQANGPQGEFNDYKLARLQFSAALATALSSGLLRDRQPLQRAGDLLVQDQLANGAWDFTGADEIGSPVTYGRPLATALAVQSLRIADAAHFAEPIRLAEKWLAESEPRSVLNAAAVVLGLASSTDPPAVRQRERCLELIQSGEAATGGWGPYVQSAPEPFDTALVLYAVARANVAGWNDRVRRGREYLQRSQLSDGSWPETTRPAERESYAQRVSTTAWATLALLATRDREARPAN